MMSPTILVAEDDPAMRRWLITVLAPLGGRVHAVSDGRLLWPILMEEDVDLVISDIRMPVLNGLDALNLVRMSGVQVPFLLITAFGGDDVRASARELGADVLDKPFAAADLLARVRRMCGLKE